MTRIGSSSSSSRGSVRGGSILRRLQNINDNPDSVEDMDPLFSIDSSNETSSVDNNNDDNSVDEDDQRRTSGFLAPRARQCTTGKLLMMKNHGWCLPKCRQTKQRILNSQFFHMNCWYTEQGSNEVVFQCRSVTGDSMSEIEDELNFQVRATSGNYLQITVSYESEVETAQSETETETQYTVVFDRLIEYRKVGNAADDHYEWNVDEVVAEWPLNTWEPLSDIQTTANNRTVFSATTGMVTFTFTISQTDSEDLTTNKMKIDFLLENYPWDASGNTFIALVSRIETEREIVMDDGVEDQVSDVLINFKDAVDTIGFVPFGEYTWATNAEATFVATTTSGNSSSIGMEDGAMNSTNVMIERSTTSSQNQTTTIAVIASKSSSATVDGTSADSTLEEIAFSFVGAGQGANRIYWDPEAGIGYTSSAASSHLVGSVVLSALALGLTLLWW